MTESRGPLLINDGLINLPVRLNKTVVFMDIYGRNGRYDVLFIYIGL